MKVSKSKFWKYKLMQHTTIAFCWHLYDANRLIVCKPSLGINKHTFAAHKDKIPLSLSVFFYLSTFLLFNSVGEVSHSTTEENGWTTEGTQSKLHRDSVHGQISSFRISNQILFHNKEKEEKINEFEPTFSNQTIHQPGKGGKFTGCLVHKFKTSVNWLIMLV